MGTLGNRIEVKVRHFPDRPALQLQWFDANGKRCTKSTGTADEKEAEQRRADLEYELNHGLYAEPLKVGWEVFREAFEAEYLPGVRPNTQRCYRAALDLFEELCASPLQLSGVGTRQVSAFAAAMRSFAVPRRNGITSYKPSTIAVHLEYLKGALSWAVEQKLLSEMPAFPSIRLPNTTPQPVPAELYERLLATAGADIQMRAFLQCGWLAGLRRDEAFRLSRELSEIDPYLDRQRRRIVFPAAGTKAGRDQWVPAAAELVADLDAVPETGVRFFRWPACSAHMSVRVQRLAAKAKVKLTFRALRRGFGCRYAARVPAQVLQKLMRHANIAVTMRYYVSMDAAVEEAVFGPASAAETQKVTAR